jgi:anti-sigma factor RsiW
VNCAEAARLFDPFVDGEASPAESASLQSHAATCAGCCQRLVDIESLGRLVRRAPYYHAPAGLRARVIGASPRSRFTPALLAWAAAMTIAASAGGVVVVRSVLSRPAVEATASIADEVVSGHVPAM